MRGSLVIAMCYGGIAVVLRVWDCNKNVIYLSEESQFQRLSTGLEALRPIGFPANDVFAYDPALAEKFGSDALDWSSLKKFSAISRQN